MSLIVPESFTETDPVFSAAPASGIAAGDISNWNTAYGWGNHAAAGYLDDYEEGTWTPAFSTMGTDFSSITYYTPSTGGNYTKIGDTVFFRGVILTSSVTVGSASGQVVVSGLPFTSYNVAKRGAVTLAEQGKYGNWNTTPSSASVLGNNTILWLFKLSSLGGSHDILVPSDLLTTTGNFMQFSGQYKVA